MPPPPVELRPENRRQTVDAVMLRDTRKAVHVRLVGDDDSAGSWLAKSQITLEPLLFGGRVRITAPAWLLLEKGLLTLPDQDQGVLW